MSSATAAAQDDQRARLHFESGASYYDAGEYQDALREFLRAYELSHRPRLFYNISICYQNLGDLEQAASYLERYLAEVEQIGNRANLEIRLRNLRERIARGGGGEEAPASAEAPAAEEALASEPEPAAESTDVAASPSELVTSPAVAEGRPSTGDEASADRPNVPAIAGFGVAALGVVGAAIFGALTIDQDSQLASSCGMHGLCTESQLSTMRTYALVTDVSIGVAIAGAAVGLVFLVIGDGEDAERASAGIDVMPMASRDGAGLVLGGSF